MSFLPGDFHPFYISSSDKIIYDSYPVNGIRYLYKSTASFNRKKLICAFNDVGTLKNDCRVDLHPRYMESMGAINVDIGNDDDYREMAIIRIT